MAAERSSDPILRVEDLQMHIETPEWTLRAVNGISFDVRKGEALGIVGESGSGKTMLALSMIGHPPPPYGRIVGGRVLYRDTNLLDPAAARDVIGSRIGYVFENPGASLDPCYRIGAQIAETIRAHQAVSAAEAERRAVELLGLVGIPDPVSASDAYPHQFSGGMQQRAVIAIALSCNPEILIADSPTSALDVTIQNQIVALIERLREQFGLTLVWISHNLGVVARLCNRLAIVYAGSVMEMGRVDDVIHRPVHPYTTALVGMSKEIARGKTLNSIPGAQPKIYHEITSCLFATRCPRVEQRCREMPIPMERLGAAHDVRCVLAREERSDAGHTVPD